MKRNLLKVLIMIGVLLNTAILPSQAATPQQIEDSIQKGLDWLVPQQQTDGSWAMWGGWYQVGATGFAVSKLEDRAYELGYSSPFDANYPYQQNVVDGLNYIFSRAVVIGPGIGFSPADEETYQTGIALMAIVGSRTPNTIVNVGNPVVDGLTYKQVAQAIVDYFVASQNPDGGWRYYMSEQPSDNSCSGFAVLGLRYAEAPLYGFQCNIPSSVTSGLDNWINAIQAADGGSEYTVGGGWENLLKTGNLLFEMSFVDDDMLTQRAQDAISYIQNHWNDDNSDPGWRPNHYQSMYCMMKGFQSMGVDSVVVDSNPLDWFNEFADAIIASQQADGSWPDDYWGDSILSTCWALLTLEKAAPPPPVNVVVDSGCACDVAGYSVGITYTVERFTVDGTLQVFEDDVLVDTVDLDNFNGTDTYTRNIASDDPGAHVWKGVLDVTSVGGGTPAHAEDTGSVNVCESPKVADIPDQIAPFQSFDLDDYLTYNGGLPVIWTYSGAPEGWTVAVDTNNMVTVTAPLGASTPVTITFTASVTCPPCNTVCKGSDDVLFTPNRPPDCSNAYADHSCLWPPNHKFANINIKGVSDPDGDPVAVTITSITSDESTASDKGSGGAKHSPDAIIAGASKASVRAERSGNSDGRVYVINFTASDEKGSECNSSVTVKVPHDQSSKTCSAVDSGQDYDATAIN